MASRSLFLKCLSEQKMPTLVILCKRLPTQNWSPLNPMCNFSIHTMHCVRRNHESISIFVVRRVIKEQRFFQQRLSKYLWEKKITKLFWILNDLLKRHIFTVIICTFVPFVQTIARTCSIFHLAKLHGNFCFSIEMRKKRP